MIEQTVNDLTMIIGTRPACRALGASPGNDLPPPPATGATTRTPAGTVAASAFAARA
jgi:hypothetical protein